MTRLITKVTSCGLLGGVLGAWIAGWCVLGGVFDASAQVVGPNINISGGTDPEVESEPSIATMGNNIAAVWFRNVFSANLRTAISRDGGFTWADATIQPQPGEAIYGRASTCIDSSGTAFCAVYGTDASLGATIFIYSGSFNAPIRQWQRRANAVPFGSELDGIRIISDRTNGTLYLVHTRGGRIQVVRSTDAGASWSEPIELSGVQCNTAQPALGPNGELYVVWEDYAQGAIVGRKSTDRGVSFEAPFTVGTIHDNLGLAPPGWRYSLFRYPPVPNLSCTGSPAFLGMAVDTSGGPHRGAIYSVWSEHGLGTSNSDPIRIVNETEPNNDFASATPVAIGDDIHGGIPLDDEVGDTDLFTFEGAAGTTIQVTGWGVECGTQVGCIEIPMSIYLVCGDQSVRLTDVGCSQVYGPSPIPPLIYTLPTTGRYFVHAGGATSYLLRLREYVISPEQAARDHRDVVLVRSTDGGATWSDKVRVNDDAPAYDNAIPAVTVDGSGRVHVAWYDRRDEPECGARVHTYWTWSEDGGATFQPSRRVSEPPSEGGRHDGLSQEGTWQVGDHMALQAEGERVYLLWTYIPIGGGGEIYGAVITQSPLVVPEIEAVTPSAGLPGTQVAIHGRDLLGVTGVYFHNSLTDFTVVGDSLIHAEVPIGARTGYLSAVNWSYSARSPDLFHVAPRITAILPSRGLAGQTIRILGVNFTGATAAQFNGVPATFTVVSDTLITATVPQGASEGPIEVTGPGGNAVSDPFLIGAIVSGINLAWDDCGSHGAVLKQFACDTNEGPPFTLVGSFAPPDGVDQFAGISADLRIINPSGRLPDWWKVSTFGCRLDGVEANYDFTSGSSSCRDPYSGDLSNQTLVFQPAYDGPSHARLTIGGSLPSDRVGSLDAALEYYGFKVLVSRAQTVGAGACSGCETGMRIELRSIQLHQPPELKDDPVISAPLDSAVVHWESPSEPGDPPTIQSFLPLQAPAGAVVGIRGLGFLAANAVTVSGAEAMFTVANDSLIMATIPADATTGLIVVTNPHGSDTSKVVLTIGPRLGGINLSWSDCGTYGETLQRFTCDVNAGAPFDLVVSFRPPPDVTSGLGVSAVLTVANPNGALPDWWKHGAAGCRMAFSTSFDFTSGPFTCMDPFQGQGVGGLTYVPNSGDPARARIIVQAAIPAEMSGPLDPEIEYYAALLRLLRSNTVGGGACAGCDTPVCIGLESVQLFQPPELGYDPVIDVPADNTVVAWQNTDPACLAITPVQVSLVTAEVHADHVRIVWELPRGEGATVHRREEEGIWRPLERLVPDGTHRIEYVDRDVRRGVTYGYRLQVDGEEVFVGETSLTVPAALWALGLGGLRWSAGIVRGTITLPTSRTATLEVFDLGGRRTSMRRFEALEAGEHSIELRAALRPGVYFGRLSQGGSAVSRRFAVVE